MPEILYGKNLKELRIADNDPNITSCVLQGGTSSGKTYAVLMFLIVKCLESKVSCLVGRMDQATCRLSCFKDLQDILIDQFGIYEAERMNKTSMVYTFANGSTISFTGLQDPAKLRGPRVDYAFINEATEVLKATVSQIKMRVKSMIVIDFNPILQIGWMYDMRKDPKCHYVESDWRDNPCIPEQTLLEIKGYEPTPENIKNGTADEYLYSVFYLNKPAKREGVIFPVWAEADYWPDVSACQFRCYGLDFGYANDPTAIVEVRLHDNKLYLKELLYEKGLILQQNPDNPYVDSLEQRLQDIGIHRDVQIIADSAEPRSIDTLRLCGYNIQAVKKGNDSIISGINLMKEYPLVVDVNSMNLKSELNMYAWKVTNGAITAKPIDNYNHLMDAIRYVALTKLKPRVNDVYRVSRKRTRKTVAGGVNGF